MDPYITSGTTQQPLVVVENCNYPDEQRMLFNNDSTSSSINNGITNPVAGGALSGNFANDNNNNISNPNNSNEMMYYPQQQQLQQQATGFPGGSTSTINGSGRDYTMEFSIGNDDDYNNGNDNANLNTNQHYPLRGLLANNGNSNSTININDDQYTTTTNNNNNNASLNSNNQQQQQDLLNLKNALLLLVALLYMILGLMGQNVPRTRFLLLNDWFIFFSQIGGIVLSCIAEYYDSSGQLVERLRYHFLYNPKDTLHALVPALCDHLYILFIVLALPNLSLVAYELTHEDKLVVTAIVSCLLLKNRTYNSRQWICLLLVSFGFAWVALARNGFSFLSHFYGDHKTHTIGLFLILVSSFLQAFGNVYLEKLVKIDIERSIHEQEGTVASTTAPLSQPPSLWIRNIQVIIYSIVIKIVLKIVFYKKNSHIHIEYIDNISVFGKLFLYLFMTILLSMYGIIFIAVLRYADNVLYGLTIGNAVVVLSILSKFFIGKFTFQIIISVILVFTCTYYFHYPVPDNMIATLQQLYARLLSTITGTSPSSSSLSSSSFSFPTPFTNNHHHRYNRIATTMSPDGMLPSHLNAATEPFLQPGHA